MVFALQKYGFWRAKTTFLAYKNHLFKMQLILENEEKIEVCAN